MKDIAENLKRLSESSISVLHGCPRRYQLYKLMKRINAQEDGEEHSIFGTSVGVGVQEYLTSGNMNRAILSTFLSWEGDLDDTYGARSKKTLWHAIMGVQQFPAFKDTELRDYELFYYEGKPATELGFLIDFGHGFYYRGFLDALLRNKRTGKFLVYEGKTTKYSNIHEAVYKNSSQALGYSVIVDTIVKKLGLPPEASSFEVFYGVYKTSPQLWQGFLFPKSHTSRADWIKNIYTDIQHIAEYAENDHFPKYGSNCYAFFRPCEFFEYCHMPDSILLRTIQEPEEDIFEKYQFHFTAEEIIQAQLERHET